MVPLPDEALIRCADRDVRNAIQTALLESNAFDGVWVWGLPEDYGTGTSTLAGTAIEPVSGSEQDLWDGSGQIGLVVTGTVSLTLLYRNEDPQLRDEGAELLLNTAADAINGQSLAGLTLPDKTRITAWQWQQPTAPERRIKATVQYQYISESWDGFDETP